MTRLVRRPPIQARTAVMPQTIAGFTVAQVAPPQQTTQKGTIMGKNTIRSVDADIEGFYYTVDLAIDPPLPDNQSKAATNSYVKLKNIKDEDVQIINGEIVVVARNVTGVESANDPGDYTNGYSEMKKGIVAIAKLSASAGSVLTGQVVVKDANTSRYLRIKVDGNNVTVEGASLGWPDGTQSPWPSEDD